MLNEINIWNIVFIMTGFKLQGPESKVCHLDEGWLPDEDVKCVTARRWSNISWHDIKS